MRCGEIRQDRVVKASPFAKRISFYLTFPAFLIVFFNSMFENDLWTTSNDIYNE